VDSFFSAGYVAALRAQPLWLHALEAVFLSDLSIYWAHRLQHRWDWLWRFHAVHHSAEHLDWLAAHREHPLDSIYSVCAMNLPIFLIGFPLETLGWLLAFRGLWAIFIHSNIRMPLGIFGLLAGSPAFHHWHHAKDRDVGNYANLSPLMDVLFGTHHAPETAPESLGLKEKMPQSYLGLLWHPFRRRERTPKTTE
jgi:sterol desaturase/sphingolipid hydroxylase (fatty acid hydroxylase superfamily)